jgi:hypothetical protein
MDTTTGYERPLVTDIGTLAQLTAACVGGGDLDESGKDAGDPFTNVSPAFGDPSFCTQ